MTNETDAWNSFFATGSVLDYLQYKSIQRAKRAADYEKDTENEDEIQDTGHHPSTTEYR